MKTNLLKISVLFMMVFFLSCSKDSPAPVVTPTSLELTVRDELGNPAIGATVKLYSSATDLVNDINTVALPQLSDASGKVKFSDLASIKYYWYAEKDCKNNYNGGVTSSNALTANTNTSFNVIMSSTGSLKFVNTSSNPYRVYINGTVAFDMNGGTTQYKYKMPTGAYTLRVLQLSGYLFTATDLTFNGTLNCGSTLSTTFP